MQGFPKISDYGLIGDGRTAALVSRFGSIEWCCLPHFDSPSSFAAILDRERGGFFSICPAGEFSSEQRYVEDTNVLETTFETASGRVRLMELFSVTTEEQKRKEFWPDHEILRIVEGLSGEVPMLVRYAPRPDYGKGIRPLERRGNIGIACSCDEKLVLFRTTLPIPEIRFEGAEAVAKFTVDAGEKIHFSVVYAEDAPAVIPPLGAPAIARTPNRGKAKWLGMAIHMLNGWAFAFIYIEAFLLTGLSDWWFGAAIGLVHAMFILLVGVRLLPGFHPRMADELRGPDPTRQLEPPGYLALHYGRGTPITTIVAHIIYGSILSLFYK